MNDALNIESFNAAVHSDDDDQVPQVLRKLTTIDKPEDVSLLKNEYPLWGWTG